MLYVILTLVNQKLQPKPEDPQMQAQMKMMSFMLVGFGFIFYNFPAGFMLYIMTSSALGIVESKIIKSQLAREDEEAGSTQNASGGTPAVAGPYPAKAKKPELSSAGSRGGRKKKRRK